MDHEAADGACPTDGGDGYFHSYQDLDVHRLMLKDRPRTLAYKTFMEKNGSLLKDKVVIDVGAGTGILSLFAAKAGASKVYAIEASGMSEACRAIVEHNGYGHVIEVIAGRVEDVQLDVKADVIVSEWMGFYLLHESMLNSVIVARDRWLRDGGLMLPSAANLYICPVSMKDYIKENHDFWTDIYGFDFSPLLPTVKHKSLQQPVITTIQPDQCLSEPELLSRLDIQFVAQEDIHTLLGKFSFKMSKHGFLQGFACWFNVEFDGDSVVELDTGPWAESTHWEQTVMLLPEPLMISKGEEVACHVTLSQNTAAPRRYDISLAIAEDEEQNDEEGSDNEGEISGAHLGFGEEVTDKLLAALAKMHENDPS